MNIKIKIFSRSNFCEEKINLMTRRWYYSILLIVASSTCVASLTRDTTLFIPGAVKRHARTSTSTTSIFSSKDPSNLSTEDLRKIAQKKGFDTNGMDRYGLERIVAEFEKSAVKSRPRLNASSKMNGQTPQESGDYMALPQSIFTDQPNGSASNQSSNGSIIQSGFINGYTFTSDEADEVDEYDQSRYEGDIEQQYKRPTKKTKKFWFTKDSFKAGLVGMLVGPVAVSPITYLHNYVFPGDVITDQLSQFEFDTLAGGFAAAGFAVLYRHFIKDDKDETLVSFNLEVSSI